MPRKLNENRRHKIPAARYRVTNRGNVMQRWYAEGTSRPGSPRKPRRHGMCLLPASGAVSRSIRRSPLRRFCQELRQSPDSDAGWRKLGRRSPERHAVNDRLDDPEHVAEYPNVVTVLVQRGSSMA